jgi:carboxyl-terminal processing protease
MPVSNRLFEILNPQNRGALKLTINQFYRVNGDSTQSRGVHSDVVLPSVIDHMDLGESFMDNALEFDRVNPAPHQDYGQVSPDIVSALREASQQRIAANEEFQKTQREIERYLARKNRKEITLNEEALRKEREDDKAERDLEKQEQKAENGEEPVFEANPYNNELLQISLDYVAQLKGTKTAQK